MIRFRDFVRIDSPIRFCCSLAAAFVALATIGGTIGLLTVRDQGIGAIISCAIVASVVMPLVIGFLWHIFFYEADVYL